MRKQKRNLTYDEISKRIREWNKENKLNLLTETVGNITTFSQLHQARRQEKCRQLQTKESCNNQSNPIFFDPQVLSFKHVAAFTSTLHEDSKLAV
jgi:hypothetical protein